MAENRKTVALPVREGAGEVWYAEGLRFKCTQCGNCCSGGPGYVWVTETDIARIAGFLGMAVTAFTAKYVRAVGGALALTEKADYDCIFLQRADGKSMCGVYPVRPTQCRTWPFWTGNLKSVEAWTRASQRCPGMCDADGRKYSLEEIEERRGHPESP